MPVPAGGSIALCHAVPPGQSEASEEEPEKCPYYQPVYLFELASKDGSYKDWIMIPAMK